MISEFLNNHGIKNYISGSDYDIRDNEFLVDNLNHFKSLIGINPKTLYIPYQKHTTNIEYADGVRGIDKTFGKAFLNTDALITDKVGVALLVNFADCTPIVLFDKKKSVLCSVHSGWRGTCGEIVKNAVWKMKEFGCDVSDIFCYIGPTIDVENYEVGKDVYDAFSHFKNRDSFFREFGEKYKLDLRLANLDILNRCGILLKNINVSEISTFNDLSFNSARRDRENYKLNCMIVMI